MLTVDSIIKRIMVVESYVVDRVLSVYPSLSKLGNWSAIKIRGLMIVQPPANQNGLTLGLMLPFI